MRVPIRPENVSSASKRKMAAIGRPIRERVAGGNSAGEALSSLSVQPLRDICQSMCVADGTAVLEELTPGRVGGSRGDEGPRPGVRCSLKTLGD
jgi:hypothetical protein